MYYCDIAIVGGGASALAAAIEGARGGASIYILERLERVGKKILVSGNGRCNLGNDNAFAGSYTGCARLADTVLSAFGDTRDLFFSLGLYIRADSEGRLYPASNSASSVLDALRLECSRLGVVEMCSFKVEHIRQSGGFVLFSEDGRRVQAKRVIFAFGGKAAPRLGTDGCGFSLLSSFGIEYSPLSPALSPLACKAPELRSLKGIRAVCRVTALRAGRAVAESSGEIQFGDGALSGICIFDLAAHAPDSVSINLLPELTLDEAEALFAHTVRVRGSAPLEDSFTGVFNKRLAQCLLRRAGYSRLSAPALNGGEALARSLAETSQNFIFSVSPSSWDKAQVSHGGVYEDELTASLELKKLAGAYVCGEAVDILGPCGGYNLHWAWSSGRCAGYYAAKTL